MRSAAAFILACGMVLSACIAGTASDGSQNARTTSQEVKDLYCVPFTNELTTEWYIHTLLCERQRAWNRGALDKFMEHYWNSADLRIVSGDRVIQGWQAAFDFHRRQYEARENAVGLDMCCSIDISRLEKDTVLVFGHWELQGTPEHGGTEKGLFTYIMRDIDEEWVIVYEHRSSD